MTEDIRMDDIRQIKSGKKDSVHVVMEHLLWLKTEDTLFDAEVKKIQDLNTTVQKNGRNI
jgi:hypothetical protein